MPAPQYCQDATCSRTRDHTGPHNRPEWMREPEAPRPDVAHEPEPYRTTAPEPYSGPDADYIRRTHVDETTDDE